MLGFFKKSKPQDYSAQVQPAGEVLQVKAGDNLLKAALGAGLAWPHDCRVGSCGTCRCTLKEGKIKPLSDFSYVLDGDQLSAGMILACQSSLRSDVVVEVQFEDASHHVDVSSHTGKIGQLTRLTEDILQVVINIDDEFPRSAVAGQYAEVKIAALDKPRSYSFAKAPQNEAEG
ncbi:MAG: 2Fe-2S iron-sulfur cluster-binding protein, partial [Gammaproteobacteria bacterium]|nr:2Fe-2S iron-sulfur cluster-binding protein [Gammaproteobacteria bacterium]